VQFFVGADVIGSFRGRRVSPANGQTRVFNSPTTADVSVGEIDAIGLAARSLGLMSEAVCCPTSGTFLPIDLERAGKATPDDIVFELGRSGPATDIAHNAFRGWTASNGVRSGSPRPKDVASGLSARWMK
jgi:hypothetical protein